MPLALIRGISGFLSAEKKSQLIQKVTDAIVSVEGEGLRPVTWVIVEDVPEGQWGIGGLPVTTQMVRELAESARERHLTPQHVSPPFSSTR